MRTMTKALAVAAASIISSPAFAHDGEIHSIPEWSFEPWIAVPLAVTAILFALGLIALGKRADHARLPRRALCFAAGWVVLALALLSPLHEAGERSFAAHMFEHELIMLVAAPLLVLARPSVLLLWGLPRSARRTVGSAFAARAIRAAWRQLTEPVTATILQGAALWGWHSPALFDLALESEAWHAIQHASFLISALLFWTAMIGDGRGRPELYAKAALCLFATSVVSGALGALMAFSESPWYAPYAALGMAPWGLTPAEDQQVAGLIMWVPGGLVHAAAALAAIVLLLRQPVTNGKAADAR